MNAMVVLGVVLAISTLGNVWQFNSRDELQKEVVQAKDAASTNLATANTCSASVEALKDRAEAAEAAASASKAQAAEQAKVKKTEGQAILSTQRTVPNNDCVSTQNLLQSWQASRKAK